MVEQVKFPGPGCVVEYLENNNVQIAMVLEEASGKLRLLLPSRRETKLSQNRILPWTGPVYSTSLGREEYVRLLEGHKRAREEKTAKIDIMDVWELAQGEISEAPASWFAELCENDSDADTYAAYGAALLDCKTHFRFQSPNFIVYDAEIVQKRLNEQKAREEKEALVAGGAAFVRALWDIASKNRALSSEEGQALAARFLPDESVRGRIIGLLWAHMVNPDIRDDEALWQMLTRGLPDAIHLPYQVLVAGGFLPEHHNFWLDRAAYDTDSDWWKCFAPAVELLEKAGEEAEAASFPATAPDNLTFISIDGAKTRDIDDAFSLEKTANGWHLTVALACPALEWPFGSQFDRKILHRATSIYLPEGDLHMLPECLGTQAYSLLAGSRKAALCLSLEIDDNGMPIACVPFLAKIRLAANLNYADAQAVLDGANSEAAINPAAPFAEMLRQGAELGGILQAKRIASGAIVMERPEVAILLDNSGAHTGVELVQEPMQPDAQRLVSEMMIIASSAIADWAHGQGIPLVHRTQNVAVPKEYAGIWTNPADLSRILRALIPSILEISAKPHAALAAERYAPITSPLRRYADLLNEGQIIHFLKTGRPRWNEEDLSVILDRLTPSLESATQVQKFRPRYWKLLFFKQKGDKIWWDGIITEENENFVSVSLPAAGIFVRGKRHMFDERAAAGNTVRLRIGKVNPLYNEIQILEAMPAE